MWCSGCIAPVEGKCTCYRIGCGSKNPGWGYFSLECNYIPVESFTPMMLAVEVSTRDLLPRTWWNLVSLWVSSDAGITERECVSCQECSH